MTEAQISVTGSFNEGKRLTQAAQHVSQLWFPVNEQLFMRIQKGLVEGIYDLDIEFLIGEIRTDFALFTYCLKEVSKSIANENIVFPIQTTPLDMLRLAGLPRLKKILSVERQRISAHSLQASTELQSSRLYEAMLCASTAEVLAEAKKVDPALGFSTGLLRQLGLSLVAWNYPTVYRRVATSLKDGEKLDESLNLTLGFSPTMLATALARQWRLSPEVRSAMGDKEAISEVSTESWEVVQTLQKICSVGEALARANDPEHYPTAESDWTHAKAEIEETLGYEGFGLIEQKANENCQNYLKLAPSVFSQTLKLDPEAKIYKVLDSEVVYANQYLKHLPPALKKRFKEIYQQIESRAVTKDTVRSLVRELIPLCGFTGGCVYTIDLESMRLIPRIKTGSVDLREVGSLSYKEDYTSVDPVISALKCSAPIIESGFGSHGELQLVVGALGEKQKVGVLYLEAPMHSTEEMAQALLMTFKAVQQTLCDCLGVS